MSTQPTDARYDEDYFIRGKQSGKSLYENYRWMPDLTIPMAERIVEHLDVGGSDSILDFGCARGYLVRALCELDYDAFGVDVSEWALRNCDESVKDRVGTEWPITNPDWVIAKDVLEHIPMKPLVESLSKISRQVVNGVFIVVPLSESVGQSYVVPEYEADVTHINRWPLKEWVGVIHDALGNGWKLESRYRIPGIKDNYAQFKRGNGFITATRTAS